MQDLWERVYIAAIGGLSARDDRELPALVERAARIADLAEEEVRRRQTGDTSAPVAVAFGKEAVEAWAMGYTDDTGTLVVEHCEAFEGNNDAADMLHDYSPEGLWYWEGYLKTLEHHAGDFDVEAVGKFYPTTAQKVRNGEAPETRTGA